MPNDAASKPDWWVENEIVRDEMNLPEYRPPRFEDGTHTHEVVPTLEDRFDCKIQFAGLDSRYPEDWHVRVNGESWFRIGHRRDENANTVYEIDSKTFKRRIVEGFES